MEPYKIYIRPGIVLAVPGVVYPGCFDRRVFTYVDPDSDCGAALQNGIPENLIICTEGAKAPLFFVFGRIGLNHSMYIFVFTF